MRLFTLSLASSCLLVPWAAAEQEPAPRAEAVAPAEAELSSGGTGQSPGFRVVPRVDDPPAGVTPDTKPGDNMTSRSASRQFVVHGEDAAVRGTFCVFAEKVKAELLALLKQPDRWKYPVHIHVRGHTNALNDGRPVRASVALTEGGGFALRALVELGQDFSRDLMRNELITLLLAERIVRSNPEIDFRGRKVLPDWLRIGISEAIEFRARDRPTELFASIFESGRMLSVNEVVFANPASMNSVSEAVYRASCCGFVLSLIAQDAGAKRLNGMIADLAVFEGTPLALLEKHFPGTDDSDYSLEKWWALELATMAQPTVKDILGPLESEEALGRCLQVRYSVEVPAASPAADGPGVEGERGRRRVWQVFRPKEAAGETGDPETRREIRSADLSEFREFIDHEGRDRIVSSAEVALLQLSYRAFPMHRPIIQEYQLIIAELRKGKTKGLDERFAKLAAMRVELARAARDATDYLLHYQATQVGRMSGAFEEYKSAVEELNTPLPPRDDPLSKYLDDLDKHYSRR